MQEKQINCDLANNVQLQLFVQGQKAAAIASIAREFRAAVTYASVPVIRTPSGSSSFSFQEQFSLK